MNYAMALLVGVVIGSGLCKLTWLYFGKPCSPMCNGNENYQKLIDACKWSKWLIDQKEYKEVRERLNATGWQDTEIIYEMLETALKQENPCTT